MGLCGQGSVYSYFSEGMVWKRTRCNHVYLMNDKVDLIDLVYDISEFHDFKRMWLELKPIFQQAIFGCIGVGDAIYFALGIFQIVFSKIEI